MRRRPPRSTQSRSSAASDVYKRQDWDHSYYTMSEENNYTIWHFLKKCHEDGLIYKGEDAVPWCPRCGTAISQHEIVTEGYKEVTHEAVYFRLPVVKKGRLIKDEFFLVWTTTPWTVPANTLLAINPDFDYVLLFFEGKKYWLGKKMAGKIFPSGKYAVSYTHLRAHETP